MNCEHVEDLLSAYLDNALTPQERVVVQEHITSCSACRETLADYRRFDALLTDLPRVSPSEALRERIFSSPEYIELLETADIGTISAFRRSHRPTELRESASPYNTTPSIEQTFGQRLTLPQKHTKRDRKTHPHLVALPGGLQETQPHIPSPAASLPTSSRRRSAMGVHFMQIAIAACLLLTLGIGGFIGWTLWQGQQTATLSGGITPPLGVRLGGPLAAGTRYVFLRDGALWSASIEDTTDSAARLTASGVTVASNWSVRPALAKRAAGNMIAYIDLKQGRLHIIRSDGQSDIALTQSLLASNAVPASLWKTSLGTSILNGLSWSTDGSKLAFIAAPQGIAHLYIYSVDTRQLSLLSTPLQNNILSLSWSSNSSAPTITWATGTSGHIRTIMLQHLGQGTSVAEILTTGDYMQATYHQQGTDSWLLLSQTHDIFTLSLNGTLRRWTNSGAANLATWSPQGRYIGYFHYGSNNSYHAITVATGNDTQIATNVLSNPAPLWSPDEALVLYGSGTHIIIASSTATTQVQLYGTLSSLSWNPAVPKQAIVTLQNGHPGLYVLDTAHGSLTPLQKTADVRSLQWTEIP